MAKWQESIENEETSLWKMYQNGINYQIKLGIRHNIPKFIDFYEGRQWPLPTEHTKNLPRPVINIVKMICRSKKSSILSTPVKIVYNSYSPNTDTEKLNSFLKSILSELGQEELDRQAIDDGIKKGSYFYHYYWDKDARDLNGRKEGGLRCEIIDPLNIFFSNPCETNEQKQEWILIATHTDPRTVMSIVDDGLQRLDLTENSEENEESADKITLLTRYFKQNGEIWCERATKYNVINKPFCLCPCADDMESNSLDEEKSYEDEPRASLFPIVCGFYERREGSIYGISEVEGIIPNQKAINFNVAMSLLNAQQCAWGKYIALPNALKGQKITNSPGQVLIDHSGTGEGIKRMAEVGLSQAPMDITNAITDLTKLTAGANDLLSSENLSMNMSGVAIAQLQAQAEVPIEELRANLWGVKKKQGAVIAQFIRLYYFEREFIRTIKDENGCECEICDKFSSSDYKSSIFDISVEAVKGTRASIASDINMLNSCLQSGKISLETYIRAYPEGALSNKSAILKQIEEEKQEEIYKLRKELEMYKNRKTVDPVSIIQ